MNKKISVANLIMLIGGVVTLLFSFFSFVKFDTGFGSKGYGSWSTDGYGFVSAIPAILAIAMVVWCVLELVGTKLPAQVLTFNANQLKASWGISAAGLMIGYLVSTRTGLSKGIGFWFMLIGSLGMAAGAVMALLGKGTEMVNLGGGGGSSSAAVGGSAPPPPPPMGGGSPPPPPPPGA